MKIATPLLAVFLGFMAHSEVNAQQFTCADLDGTYVIGQDSAQTYLGFFGSRYANESIMNPYGPYGSEYQTDSVRNQYDTFGSPYSSYSANNDYTSSPPVIVRRGESIAYLTSNPYKTPGVSLADIDATCEFSSTEPDVSGGGGTNFTMSVSKTGTGSGAVTSDPSGINCGSTCSASFASGTNITLTATPANGSTFKGWGGDCSIAGTSTTCSGTMDQPYSVTAIFDSTPTPTNYTVSVSKTGTGSGTVTSNPSGISCGSTCSTSFESGTNVTLTANPASGSTFSGWNGSCSGTGNCSVSMSQARSVTATFQTSGAVEVTSAFSGLWYNPDQDGHGFSISVHSATSASVYWYTFDPFGNPLWIAGAGDIIADRIESTAYVLQGMQFGTWNPADREVYNWGSFEIEFHSCNSATLTYDSTFAYESGEEFGSGTIQLVRLASVDGLECSDTGKIEPIVTNQAVFSGLWYNPDQDGHGFSISVHSATSASVYWYTFDPFGYPLWIAGAGDIIADRIESTAYVLQGMQFGTWNPADREVYNWGSFEIEFHSCNSATLTYDSTLSYESGEEFGSGTIQLVRLASVDGLECE